MQVPATTTCRYHSSQTESQQVGMHESLAALPQEPQSIPSLQSEINYIKSSLNQNSNFSNLKIKIFNYTLISFAIRTVQMGYKNKITSKNRNGGKCNLRYDTLPLRWRKMQFEI